MIKSLFAILFLSTFLYSNELVDAKIKNLIEPSIYAKNRAFIEAATTPKSEYIKDGNVDTIKLIKTLKDNGILKLLFKTPREVNITFKTKANPNFFVKVMNDSLTNIGYYKFITKEALYDEDSFTWRVSMLSEVVVDPIILDSELKKSNSSIIDVSRQSESEWSFVVDMSQAVLNVSSLDSEFNLKRSLYATWLNVKGINSLSFYSSSSNSWYPYIAFYDSNLNIIGVKKVDSKTSNLNIEIDPKCSYIKISDIYSLKNIKDDIIIKASR